jgi:hypothetical protein
MLFARSRALQYALLVNLSQGTPKGTVMLTLLKRSKHTSPASLMASRIPIPLRLWEGIPCFDGVAIQVPHDVEDLITRSGDDGLDRMIERVAVGGRGVQYSSADDCWDSSASPQ